MCRRPLFPPHRTKNWCLYTGYEAEAFEPSVAPCKTNYEGTTIQRFKSSDTPRAQWNGAFRLQSPEPNHLAFVFFLVSRIQKSGTGYNNFYRNGLFQFDVPTDISGTVLNGRKHRTLLVCIVRLVNSLHSGYDLIRSG